MKLLNSDGFPSVNDEKLEMIFLNQNKKKNSEKSYFYSL